MAAPTIVTAPHLFEELWTLAGRRMADDVELRAMGPFYRIRFHDGSHFDYSADTDRMRAEVARFNPADVAGFDRLMAEGEFCCKLGFDDLGAVAFDGACLRGKCEADHDLGYELMGRFASVMIDRLQHTRLRLLDVYGDRRAS